jgi:hypothetical protein
MIDLQKDYHGATKNPIHWRHVQTPENGCLSLSEQVTPSELVVTYALTYVFSSESGKATLLVGSDDGIKVFFNGKEVYRFLGEQIAEPDQAEIEVTLNPGWNKLLLKIENNLGQYAFYARFINPDNKLIVSADQKTNPVIIK